MIGDFLIFGGENSQDYGITVEMYPNANAPERVIEKTTIPGRSGDLVHDTGAFGNITKEYTLHYFDTDIIGLSQYVRRWLLGKQGYQRLEDSFEPDFYRMAVFAGPLDVEVLLNRAGRCTVEFDCQPQRWRKDGELPIVLTASGGTLYNELMPARPTITVYGDGAATLTVGGTEVQITDIDEYVTLDCERENAYKGTVNKNGTIYAPEFPVLQPGSTAITWTGGVTKVEIIPRWWTL